ncbi:hypothetical protein ABID56_001013 [Alkalibacillus flavidus]|uniref:Uncharacterized protein n=1 Tax=Alkalibacillus flavidus TaxID=546021 RepID=A0ABV2KTL7_9BACI
MSKINRIKLDAKISLQRCNQNQNDNSVRLNIRKSIENLLESDMSEYEMQILENYYEHKVFFSRVPKKDSSKTEIKLENLDIDTSKINRTKLEEYISQCLSNNKFLEKIKKFSKYYGFKVVYVALILYYTMDKPEISEKNRTIIFQALAGFRKNEVTLDKLFDAIAQVISNIDENVKLQAKKQLHVLFGNNISTTEIDKNIDNMHVSDA